MPEINSGDVFWFNWFKVEKTGGSAFFNFYFYLFSTIPPYWVLNPGTFYVWSTFPTLLEILLVTKLAKLSRLASNLWPSCLLSTWDYRCRSPCLSGYWHFKMAPLIVFCRLGREWLKRKWHCGNFLRFLKVLIKQMSQSKHNYSLYSNISLLHTA